MRVEPTTMTETYDPSNGRKPEEQKVKTTVIRINRFPDDVQVARGRISMGDTLNKAPGTYEMARYDCMVEMPFQPTDVDQALEEMEGIVEKRVEAFRKQIRAGINRRGPGSSSPSSSSDGRF